MEKLHKSLSDAIFRLLRPLVRVRLKHGMAYGTFAELARRAFVEEGFEHMERAGKRSTISGVSALTGLTRKQTKALRENTQVDMDKSAERYNRALRVIRGWVKDREFHNESSETADLHLTARPGVSLPWSKSTMAIYHLWLCYRCWKPARTYW